MLPPDAQAQDPFESYDLGGKPAYVPNDLFRFKSAGTRSELPTDTSVYFSLDGGTTNLQNFNSTTPGDVSDWASNGSADAFNAFAVPGVALPLTQNDVTALDVVGYTVAVPEPTPARLLGIASATILLSRRMPARRSRFHAPSAHL